MPHKRRGPARHGQPSPKNTTSTAQFNGHRRQDGYAAPTAEERREAALLAEAAELGYAWRQLVWTAVTGFPTQCRSLAIADPGAEPGRRCEVAFSKLDYLRDLRGAKISASEFRVLVMVLTYADQHGERAFPGIALLAEDCQLSERQVQRCLDKLRAEGYLDEKRRGRRNVGATTYTLTARHGCHPEDDSARHGCHVSTTPVSSQHDMGVVPLGPIDGPVVPAPPCTECNGTGLTVRSDNPWGSAVLCACPAGERKRKFRAS